MQNRKYIVPAQWFSAGDFWFLLKIQDDCRSLQAFRQQLGKLALSLSAFASYWMGLWCWPASGISFL